MIRIAVVIIIAGLLGGCGALGTLGTNPLQGGACLGATTGTGSMASAGQITFSAPAGTSFALCSW